MKDVNTVFILF